MTIASLSVSTVVYNMMGVMQCVARIRLQQLRLASKAVNVTVNLVTI